MTISQAIVELKTALEAADIHLEFIKIDRPLYESEERAIASIEGVGIQHKIYEHQATHWVQSISPLTQQGEE